MSQGQQSKTRGEPGSKAIGEKLRGQQEKVPDRQEDANSIVLRKVQGLIGSKDLVGLKTYLQKLAGQVITIAYGLRHEIGTNVIRLHRFNKNWNTQQILAQLEKYIQEADYFNALEFVSTNEQFILERWVDSLLKRKLYHQAEALLQDYAKTKPSKPVNKLLVGMDATLEASVDAQILAGLRREIGEELETGKDSKSAEIALDFRHDRIWSMVHHSYYAQAIQECQKLDEEVHGSRGISETLDQRKRRHEKEFRAGLPKTLGEMRRVFNDLPELIANFHRLADFDKKTETYLEALKGTFQLLVSKMFAEDKIVIEQGNTLSAEEKFLELVDELGDIGYHLYIDTQDGKDSLLLLFDHEVEAHHVKADLRILSQEDIILDKINFRQVTQVQNETSPASVRYIWTAPKRVKIQQGVAEKLIAAA